MYYQIRIKQNIQLVFLKVFVKALPNLLIKEHS